MDRDHLHAQDVHEVRQHLLLVEKNRVADAFQRGLLSSAVHDRLRADIDARILELESGEDDDAEKNRPQPEQA